MKECVFEKDGEMLTLRDCIEWIALDICEDYAHNKKTETQILAKCKILNSVSTAYIAIKP